MGRSVTADRAPSILFIAPVGSGKSASNVVGGNRLMAEELMRELGRLGFGFDILDTSGGVTNLAPWKLRAIRLARFLRVVRGVVGRVRRSRVVFLFIAPRSAAVLAASVWAVCKVARRPMVLRLSGSGFGRVYSGYGAPARWLADRSWMRCPLVYVETRELYRQFGERANFRWLPQTRSVEPTVGGDGSDPPAARGIDGRPPASAAASRPGTPRNLVFISRLIMDKGLAETLDACRGLPEGCRLQVFGPPTSETDFSLFAGHPRAAYGGVLEPQEVGPALKAHDLLVHPSYYESEGYSGVILEAFQCGVPVVAARWGGVPELVEHEKNGLLVEPRSARAVRAAIDRLLEDPDLYQRLCEGARRSGERFRGEHWFGRMAEDLLALCRS